MTKTVLLVLALAAIAYAAPRYENLEAAAEAYFQRMQAQEKSYMQQEEDEEEEDEDDSLLDTDDTDIEDRIQKIREKLDQLQSTGGALTEKEKEVIMEIEEALRMTADKKGITGMAISFPDSSNPDKQQKVESILKKFQEQEESKGLPDDSGETKIKEIEKLLKVIAKARGLKGLKIGVKTNDIEWTQSSE